MFGKEEIRAEEGTETSSIPREISLNRTELIFSRNMQIDNCVVLCLLASKKKILPVDKFLILMVE